MGDETKLMDTNQEKAVEETQNKSLKTETLQSSQSGQTDEEIEKTKKQATLLFLQGKRSIFIRDYQAAVAALSESCQLFSQIYPDQDFALADPYFYYGKALLEIGRSESEVLGDQMQDENEGNDDDDDDDEDDEDEDDEEDEEEENEENKDKPELGADKDSKEIENGVGSDVKNGEQSQDKGEENKTEKEKNESENGEINDLQLSWEYLELAKLIYSKKSDTCKETAIKLAETYLCLGENGLESENYSVAVEDIKQALELQKKHLPVEDRRIAETYYQLGVAHSLSQNYDEAIESFQKSIEQLKKKIASLELRKKIGDKKTEEEEKDAFYTMDGEIEEIECVIKDVNEKIKDMVESKNQMKAELLKQVVSGGGQASSSSASGNTQGSSSSSSSSIPATDISHLVRKKRKNDEEETHQEKKTKTDN